MAFPVMSTSVYAPSMKRANRVVGRSKVAKLIRFAAVFACRFTAGTTLFSAHAYGKASDLMLKKVSRANAEKVGRNVVLQATKRTFANRGRPLKGVNFVIFGTTQWVRGKGFSHYSGVPHDNHVHMAEHGSISTRPPCAK